MIFACVLEQLMYFNIKADNAEAAQDWLNTHDFDDVIQESGIYDIQYDDRVIEEMPDDSMYSIDISTEDDELEQKKLNAREIIEIAKQYSVDQSDTLESFLKEVLLLDDTALYKALGRK